MIPLAETAVEWPTVHPDGLAWLSEWDGEAMALALMYAVREARRAIQTHEKEETARVYARVQSED